MAGICSMQFPDQKSIAIMKVSDASFRTLQITRDSVFVNISQRKQMIPFRIWTFCHTYLFVYLSVKCWHTIWKCML